MFTAEKRGLDWYVCQDGEIVGSWMVGRMPHTKEECEDAAQRLNNGATIRDLPEYQRQHMQRIVARAPWGDTYTAQDAENGCIPSEAYYVEEESE